MKFIGVDYGEKRVGIATSDEVGNMAFPYSVIQNSKNIVQDIKNIVEKEGVVGVVVGESKDFKGVENKIMVGAKKFVEKLEDELNIKVYWEPEFLTSHQAEKLQLRRSRSESRPQRREPKNDMLDASSATIILQSFLDKRKNGL